MTAAAIVNKKKKARFFQAPKVNWKNIYSSYIGKGLALTKIAGKKIRFNIAVHIHY